LHQTSSSKPYNAGLDIANWRMRGNVTHNWEWRCKAHPHKRIMTMMYNNDNNSDSPTTVLRVMVVGASSGMGKLVASELIGRGHRVIVAARRVDRLAPLCQLAPERVTATQLDVTAADAADRIRQLIADMGGIDLYVHAAGVGWRNPQLNGDTELTTVQTNAMGFVRVIDAVFTHMADHGGGHIACITSIAGTKGLGAAPAYSATKALQTTYLQALQQLANARHLGIRITDVRPGFVDTDLLADGHHYPLLISPHRAAQLIVRHIDRRTHVATITTPWRIITALWRLVPQALWWHLPIGLK